MCQKFFQPTLHYLRQQITSSLIAPVAAFKASQLFNPYEIRFLNFDASFPFSTQEDTYNFYLAS